MSVAGVSHASIERLLSDALGEPVPVSAWTRIEPWHVYRVRIDGGGSVIVKRLRTDPSGFRVDPAQVTTENAALRFLASLGLDIAPRVVAYDDALHVIVLEDLRPRVPLPDVIIEGDPQLAADGSLAFFRALGSLNAATAARDVAYDGPVTASPEDLELARWRETLRSAEALGVAASDVVAKDITAMFDELADPGGFLAMSNGDPGTNNFLVAPGLDGKLIDFEFARFRHALQDAVHIHVQSPQWITLPDPRPLEDAYRRALAAVVSEAEDDARFDLGLTAACLSYALVRLARVEKLAARRPGDLSRLQLVATLVAAAGLAEARGVLRELGGWCHDVATAIRRRWPDTDIDLSALPAFLARDDRSRSIIDAMGGAARGT